MTKPPATDRLGAGRHVELRSLPDTATVALHSLTTSDGATTTGVLFTVPGAQTVVTVMHPRLDTSRHYLIPDFLEAGFAVWSQSSRNVGNDLTLVHEQAILDVAAGMAFLRDSGFEHVAAFGNSGGSGLYAYYLQQAGRPATERIAHTPAGQPSGLPDAEMPMPDAAAFLAPHPGQGALLLGCIDPSVTDEDDPLSVDPAFDPYDPANGFAEPPESASYSTEFLERYRTAQRDRVARIDEKARAFVAERDSVKARFKESGDIRDRRASLAPRIITVYRTDAEPRTVDLTLDPSERPYGSVFGRRPDVINYGLAGFGRLTTPDAWLSTWSGLSSNASFKKCAPEITLPVLVTEFTGDQSAFPSTIREIYDGLASSDKRHERVRGTHFGGPGAKGEPTGGENAAPVINGWLAERFPSA
jgi:hypothetical protein